MKFREHRGSLYDSMATLVVVDGKKGLVAHIKKLLKSYIDVSSSDVLVSLYGSSGDARIGWEKVYIVTVKGYGVIGFSDGPVEPESGKPVAAVKARRRRKQ